MNLYLRLLWTLWRSWRLPRLNTHDKLVLSMRVLPFDIDANGHMNNGRYLTLVDLIMIEFFGRSGALSRMFRKKWRPVVTGTLISYRKGLKPWEPYQLQLQLIGANSQWIFLRFEFIGKSGKVCASGYTKGAAMGKAGLISSEEFCQAVKWDIAHQALPPAVLSWQKADEDLSKEHAR